jgi:hypothetical protein
LNNCGIADYFNLDNRINNVSPKLAGTMPQAITFPDGFFKHIDNSYTICDPNNATGRGFQQNIRANSRAYITNLLNALEEQAMNTRGISRPRRIDYLSERDMAFFISFCSHYNLPLHNTARQRELLEELLR